MAGSGWALCSAPRHDAAEELFAFDCRFGRGVELVASRRARLIRALRALKSPRPPTHPPPRGLPFQLPRTAGTGSLEARLNLEWLIFNPRPARTSKAKSRSGIIANFARTVPLGLYGARIGSFGSPLNPLWRLRGEKIPGELDLPGCGEGPISAASELGRREGRLALQFGPHIGAIGWTHQDPAPVGSMSPGQFGREENVLPTVTQGPRRDAKRALLEPGVFSATENMKVRADGKEILSRARVEFPETSQSAIFVEPVPDGGPEGEGTGKCQSCGGPKEPIGVEPVGVDFEPGSKQRQDAEVVARHSLYRCGKKGILDVGILGGFRSETHADAHHRGGEPLALQKRDG